MQSGSLLADLRNHQNVRLESTIQNRIENLKLILDRLQDTYKAWIQNLEKYRHECSLLKLFSNREIMILIILLRTSSQYNLVRHRFLKRLFSFQDPNKQAEEDEKRTIHCLSHYLRAVRIQRENLTNERLRELYQAYQIDPTANTDACLKKLCAFLGEVLENEHKILEKEEPNHENRQYLVSVNSRPSTSQQISFENDFDLNTCCILLNVFQDRLPSWHQLLWCSTTSDEEIHLFFSRIRSFPRLTFVIMDVDKMHHRLREVLLNEQDLLARGSKAHGTVYYFSRELNESRKGLRRFDVPSRYVDRDQSVAHLSKLFRKHQIQSSQIQIVYGEAGIGKSMISE